ADALATTSSFRGLWAGRDLQQVKDCAHQENERGQSEKEKRPALLPAAAVIFPVRPDTPGGTRQQYGDLDYRYDLFQSRVLRGTWAGDR
ncbi:MAG TPA: hypothetical protein VM490_23750, partial [Armatimonadaceae bacterium]|nr:hypothetical protein [Armatimonadaceae bacterium]